MAWGFAWSLAVGISPQLSWEKKEWVTIRTWLQPNGERGFDVGLPVWFMSTALCLDRKDNFCMCAMPGPLGLEGMAKKWISVICGRGSTLPHRAKPGCGWCEARVTWLGQTGVLLLFFIFIF